tara:strand:+ start:362 stop:721 length:360 start_codon:yes stop_codon:yes gene_type:complete
MEKYLSVTVTAASIAGGQQIIPCTGIVSVVQASATQVDIFYNTAAAAQDKIEITHDALPAYAAATPDQCNAMRNWVVDSINTALATSWQSPVVNVTIPSDMDSNLPGNPTPTITAIALA